jgi:hypothetical protein
MLNPISEIRRDDGCLDYSGGIAGADQNGKVLVVQCHSRNRNQRWIYNEVNLISLIRNFTIDHSFFRIINCII